MWWLILCVIVTGLRDAQVPAKPLFLSISLRASLEKINKDWFCRLTEITLTNLRWSGEGLNTTKRQRKCKFSLCLSWDSYLLPSNIDAPCSQAFRHRSEPTPVALWFSGFWVQVGTTSLVFLGCQLANSKSWEFSVFIIVWVNPS